MFCVEKYKNNFQAHTIIWGPAIAQKHRRNLMVIDPLTPSQGNQFDHRLKIFSVSWSTAHTLKFDMLHVMFIKLNF